MTERGLGPKKIKKIQGAESTKHWMAVYVGFETTKNYEKNHWKE